jgi:hypothetical protein
VTGPSPSDLDDILAIQLAVAWAGEGLCEPPRLGWWRTDLVDPEGGGDLLKRLLPRTSEWASLSAVREVARRADERARQALAQPDHVLSLFHLGFQVDELLDERLAEHRGSGRRPADVLPLPCPVDRAFERERFASVLRSLDSQATYEATAAGREVKGAAPLAPGLLAKRLAAALVPLAAQYPLPFVRVRA